MEERASLVKTKSLDVCQSGECVLANVNIDIKTGDFVYLLGKVGSGKSSLLKTLYAELPIERGEVFVSGYNLNNIKRKQIPFLRRKMGIVFQEIELLNDRNVYDNLKFALKAIGWKKKKEIKKRIIEVLELVGMFNKINSFPQQLSGGEKQSINIARAILNNPSLIIADEPSSNLDFESSEKIMNILTELNKCGTAIIVVTHNYSLIEEYNTQIYLCDNHRVIKINSVSEIRKEEF